MSIGNYGELKTAIASWLHRTDLTNVIPDFIRLAESRIANDVRCRVQEARSTASISTEYFDIPTDFLAIRDIQINSDPIQPLEFLSPKALSKKFPSSTTGKPKYYTLHGDEFQVKPVPSTTYSIEISYYSRFSTLTNDADNNWLLSNHPGIYLYASCLEGAAFVDEGELGQKFISLYQSALTSLNETENRAKYGNVLAARVNTATP